MSKSIETIGNISTFRIGTDPEFNVLDTDGFAKSISGVNDTINGVAQNYGIDHGNGPEIGSDGSHTIELRPKPSMTVGGLLKNVQTLMNHPRLYQFRNDSWKAGAVSYYKSVYGENERDQLVMIGGHVHVEVPYAKTNTTNDLKNFVPREVATKRLQAMDMVTRFFEDMDLHPKAECEARRRGGYGKFGHFYPIEPTAYSIPRIEYRTPCSWIMTPNIAFITLTGIKLAVISPETVLRTLQTGSTEKMFASMLKLFRLYQNVDQDSYVAANKVMRSPNVANYDRLHVDPKADFKKAWKLTPVPATAQTQTRM